MFSGAKVCFLVWWQNQWESICPTNLSISILGKEFEHKLKWKLLPSPISSILQEKLTQIVHCTGMHLSNIRNSQELSIRFSWFGETKIWNVDFRNCQRCQSTECISRNKCKLTNKLANKLWLTNEIEAYLIQNVMLNFHGNGIEIIFDLLQNRRRCPFSSLKAQQHSDINSFSVCAFSCELISIFQLLVHRVQFYRSTVNQRQAHASSFTQSNYIFLDF